MAHRKMVPVSWSCALLILLVQVNLLLAYNVDDSPERIFFTNGSRFFGYRVQQIQSTNGERILAGNPDLGQLHSCDVISGTCDVISLPDDNTTKHVGLTLEVEPKSGRCIVCGLALPRECDESLYMSGACYMMDSNLAPPTKLITGYQECQKADVDLCFLFDGSTSTGEPELNSIKLFLQDANKKLRNTTMNLAIVQYSHLFQTELDFNQYQTFNNLTDVINNIKVMRGGTRSFHAINYAMNNIFTLKAGHRPHAKKVLLLLTDGDTIDKEGDIIKRADTMGVKRYLIGFGNNFNISEGTRKLIAELASKPTDVHTEVLKNITELENLFTELQKKIMRIEGVETNAQDTGFTREFSSAGLSAALTKEDQILGDPGIHDWAGGLLDISRPKRLLNISLQDEDKYAYLGYAVEVLNTPEGIFYVTGAPRYQYVGLVSVLQETSEGTQLIQNISGLQVGSYFGSEIEVCDTDQDELSDVVLIAAPHFYDVRCSGQVSVYRYLEGSLQFQTVLHGVAGHHHSQFGAAVSALDDLNGDGFSDVAVGAPYEMEGRGAVYIFSGEAGGVNARHTQRLTAPAGSFGFGLSVDGVLDMTRDGLADVSVGAAGSVALYRAQPVVNVNVTITAIPPEIPFPTVESASCAIEQTLQICVESEIQTTQYRGPLNVSLQYTLVLDSGRPASRMSFTNSQRAMKKTVAVGSAQRACWNGSIPNLDCFLEDSSPVLVTLMAYQIPDVSPWRLSPSSRLANSTQISFQICGSGGSCEPDFHLHLTMEKLVVEEGASFSVFLKLQNKGENAQRVQLLTTYPSGLSFRKVNITEASRRISISCEDSATQSLVCNVSHPLMRRASWADIHIMFGIVSNVSWPDRVLLSVNVTSDNDGNRTSTTKGVTRDIPVLYPSNIITRRMESSTKYLQFLELKKENVSHAYQIRNLGPVHTNFNVTVMTPAMDTDKLAWTYNVTNWVSCGNCSELDPSQTTQEATKLPGKKIFLCLVGQNGTININVTGMVRPTHPWKVTTSENLSTAVTVSYDETRYHSQLGSKFHHVQVMTQVDLVVLPDHVPYIAGGTVGGLFLLLIICVLLYKCGFFKRYKDRLEEGSAFSEAQQPMAGTEDDTKGPQKLMAGNAEDTERPQNEEEDAEGLQKPLTSPPDHLQDTSDA